MSKIIGVDLDEVLCELLDYTLAYHNYQIGGQGVTRDDIRDYYIYKAFPITFDEAIIYFRKAIMHDVLHYEIPPVPKAKETILSYKTLGYRFYVVTARPILLKEYTEKWIEKHFPDIFENILFGNHFTSEHKDKSTLCLENGIETMVEDNFDYAFELASHGIKTFLFEKPWNIHRTENHPSIIRVKGWDEVQF